jgi:hypothetical protein
MSFVETQQSKGGATVTVVLSADRGKSKDR